MKKTASILLLTLLAFNWVGYRFVSAWLETNSDHALEARIEKSDYDQSQLIELRVPLNAPYLATASGDFERYDGEIEIDGVHYKYVKRKVDHGDLVLLCLPDENKTRLQNSKVDFFKLVNDLNQTSQNKDKQGSSFKSLSAEYKELNNCWTIQPVDVSLYNYATFISAGVLKGYNGIPEQPPRNYSLI